MTIKFNHPPLTGTTDPFNDFKPNESTHYPTGKGLYIYGLRLKIDGVDGKKFVPLVVGITYEQPLKKRLFEHYSKNSTGGASVQAKFNFSIEKYRCQQLKELYEDMEKYDKLLHSKDKLNKIIKMDLKNLIYLQDLNFYFQKFGNWELNENINCSDNCMVQYKGVFDRIFKPLFPNNDLIDAIKDQIKKTKAKFDEDFYYVYAGFNKVHISGENVPNNPTNLKLKHFLEELEYATKHALHKIGIYTTAGEERIATMATTIDISEIKNCLINLTDNILPDRLNFP